MPRLYLGVRLNRLEKVALGAFLFWSIAGLIFTIHPVGPAQMAQWPLPTWGIDFCQFCLSYGDPILIVLAFINSHLVAWRQWGMEIAREWAIGVLLASGIIETLGVETGWIFGHYHYTDQFGPLIGVIPFTIPLAWHLVLTQSLLIVHRVRPHLARYWEAACVATLATAYDLILEPFATQVKSYWVWENGIIPLQNYLAWWVLAFAVTWALAPTPRSRYPGDIRPWLLIGCTVLIFAAGRLLHMP